MLCAIYRSPKRDQTYLYIEKRDDFSRVPTELMETFGPPQFAMLLNLAGRNKLAAADIKHVRCELKEKGFYLQVPPPVDSLLSSSIVIDKVMPE